MMTGSGKVKNGVELLVLNKRIHFTGKGFAHLGVVCFCYKYWQVD